MSQDLKPCPFLRIDGTTCPGDPYIYYAPGRAFPAIGCTNCDATGPKSLNEDAAVDAWNRRRPSEREKLLEKVAEASGRLYSSLVPFTGSINTEPIPGIRSRCRVGEGGRYTNKDFAIPLVDALAALQAYDERIKEKGK